MPGVAALRPRLGQPTPAVVVLLTDVAVCLLAVVAARALVPASVNARLLWAFPALVALGLVHQGALRTRPELRALDGIGNVLKAAVLAAAVVLLASDLLVPAEQIAPALGLAVALAIAGATVSRMQTFLVGEVRQAPKRLTPTLVVGAGRVGAQLERRLRDRPELGLRTVGFIDDDPMPAGDVDGRSAPILGTLDDLEDALFRTGARQVLVAFSQSPDHELQRAAATCARLGVDLAIVPRMFESVNRRVELDHLGGIPVLRVTPPDTASRTFAVKHAFDRLVALAMLVALLPVFVGLIVTIKLSSPGPVFFRQRRVGRDGREFEMLKFRSMSGSPETHGEADAQWLAGSDGGPAPDRRTGIGRVMRKFSIDELPQLINVARGEMSLVGPRPERTAYVERFADDVPRYTDRHRVKCGLTGWAQVNGLRGQTSITDRVEWDNYYIENWSLGLDVRILAMTLLEVVRSRGD